MVTLKTLNYIHTLFLYEFSVPANVAFTVRFCLQNNSSVRHLYFEWAETRLMQNNIPKFKYGSKYNPNWYLFENNADLNSYMGWLCSNPFTERRPPQMKYLNFARLDSACGFCMRLYGPNCTYGMEEQDMFSPGCGFDTWRYNIDTDTETHMPIEESDFYEKIERFLEALISTNKIPFDSYNVK